MQGQQVVLAGRSRQTRGHRKILARLRAVIAKIVDRLADFRHGVWKCTSALTDYQRNQLRSFRFEHVGSALKDCGARGSATRVPFELRSRGSGESTVDCGFIGVDHTSYDVAVIRGADHGFCIAVDLASPNDGSRGKLLPRSFCEQFRERFEDERIVKIEPG